MRKTKIVCTIGPASSDEKIFENMCKAGLNIALFNLLAVTLMDIVLLFGHKFRPTLQKSITDGSD